jgi:hypothetical protein
MPPVELTVGKVVRVNDGNDSNVDREMVMEATKDYEQKFYNTAIPRDLVGFDAPVVLTINPAKMTDTEFYKLGDELPTNLMFVRIRTNTWNLEKVVKPAVEYYTERKHPVAVVLTFMAYYEINNRRSIPKAHTNNYKFGKRTLNSYDRITTGAWRKIMDMFKDNYWVYSCSRIEGELGITMCHRCGNCLREYFYTMARIEKFKGQEKV